MSANFYLFNYLFIIIYIYLEIFYSLLFFSIFRHTKYSILTMSKKLSYYLFKNNIFSIAINLNLIYLITLKSDYCSNNMLSFIILYFILNKFLLRYINYNIIFINYNVILFIYLFTYIKTLIAFFLLMELYSILFYFFFLNNVPKSSTLTLLQYKNMLILYLLNNFFISILCLIGINSIIEIFGTTNFVELSLLNTTSYSWKIYFIIIGFLFKLALPGFHFLKLEVYKYLTIDIVILYSVITIFINYLVVMYLFNYNFIFGVLNYYKYINILFVFTIFFFIHKIKLTNFNEFIAYSGFATNNLVLVNFLI